MTRWLEHVDLEPNAFLNVWDLSEKQNGEKYWNSVLGQGFWGCGVRCRFNDPLNLGVNDY